MPTYEQALERTLSAILCHATGDALGLPVQFFDREEVRELDLTQMIASDVFETPAGSWSDDTSMTLATLDTLSRTQDLRQIMQAFCRWMDHGEYTPTGYAYDLGNTTVEAIETWQRTKGRWTLCGGTEEWDNGNGSLMRIIPAALYGAWKIPDLTKRLNFIHCVSALTHGHWRSMIGCGIYACILWELLDPPYGKDAIARGLEMAKECYGAFDEFEHYHRLYDPGFSHLPDEEIRSSGYVVDTLEAALWCVLNTSNYRDCMLKAINLGDDTDTVAAVAGGLAGLIYGWQSIPEEWYAKLQKSSYIVQLCKQFAESVAKDASLSC